MTAKEKIRIGLINTPTIYKEGLNIILRKYLKVDITGDITCKQLLPDFLKLNKPNILLVDFNNDFSTCLSTIKKVLKDPSNIKVIIVVNGADESVIMEALEVGVHGVVSRDSEESDIIKAIQEVYKGNVYYSQTIVSKIHLMLAGNSYNKPRWKKPVFTAIEEQVIQGICKEMTSKEIAQRLYVSVRTVEGYRLRILNKIRARTTVGIVIYAIQKGLFKVEWDADRVVIPEKKFGSSTH